MTKTDLQPPSRPVSWFAMHCSFFVVVTLLSFMNSCESTSQEQEALARQHCGSCHLMPEPGLLDKKSWELGVLPEMAFRMGLKNKDNFLAIPPGDSAAVYGSLPAKPMVTEKEWDAIRNYYIENAPDALEAAENAVDTTLSIFGITPFVIPLSGPPFITLLKVDTITERVLAGTLSSALYEFDKDFIKKDSFHLKSPPSDILIENGGVKIISLLGILEPNEQAKGEMISLSSGAKIATFLDSLQRPVSFEKTDLNNDGLDDYVVCDFGNYTGALLAYENLGNGKFKKHVLYGVPGARKIVVRDMNHDGLKDILVLMTQGNEQIALLTNQARFSFAINPLLRFPPVYGSSYFDLVDFNRDGNPDILYTNGDNGDFSYILKPYHGVRIFMNDGRNKFSEFWFYPMYGASKAIARDFDQDGDLDIAAISFFPDFEKHPERGFIFLENTTHGYTPHSTAMASSGRWLVMDAADIDRDGDCDLVLGAFDYDFHVPPELVGAWFKKNTSLLILRNTLVVKEKKKPI